MQGGRVCFRLCFSEQQEEGYSCTQSKHHETVRWRFPQGTLLAVVHKALKCN